MEKRQIKVPPKWADDPISSFIDDSFANCLYSFARSGENYSLLLRVEKAFETISENLNGLSADLLFQALFLIKSRSAFRGAYMLALSGQITNSFPLQRSCLEWALYAFHINNNPELGDVWVRRHESDEHYREVKNKLKPYLMIQGLEKHHFVLSLAAQKLYDSTIDFGAHPNQKALTSAMDIDDEGYRPSYLAPEKSDDLLLAVSQIGYVSLRIFRTLFRKRFDLLSITDRLDELGEQVMKGA